MQKQDDLSLPTPALQQQLQILQERATKDALSGLLNRITTESYINQRLEAMAPDDSCAMFVIDLDQFKRVNDTLGHQAGDLAIRQASRTLSSLFRANDIVGRLGGDEFAVFLSGRLTEESVREAGTAVCGAMRFVLEGTKDTELTASVGIHYSQSGPHNFDSLYRLADSALYRAKSEGRGRFCLSKDNDTQIQPDQVFSPVSSIPLSGFLEYMDSGIALVDARQPMRIIYGSPSFFRMAGGSSSQFTLPKLVSDFVHPDDYSGLETTLIRSLEEHRPVEHIHRVHLLDGTWGWWHIRAMEIHSDAPHPVILITFTDVTKFRANELQLRTENQRLRAAFEQTDYYLWEVQIPEKSVSFFSRSAQAERPLISQISFPEALISNGWIHPDSVDRFRQFADEMLKGHTQGYGNFIVRFYNTGCFGWAALSYRTVCDDAGQPIRAVGILKSLPLNFGQREFKAPFSLPFPNALTADLILGMRGNLTNDTLYELWAEGRDITGNSDLHTCTQLLHSEKGKIFSRDKSSSLEQLLDRSELLRRFAAGERWFSATYRRTDGSGSIHSVYLVLYLAEDPVTHDGLLFLYLCQAEYLRSWEQELTTKVVHDPVTRVYDRSTARALIEAMIHRQSPASCALVLLQIGGLSKLLAGNVNGLNRKRHYLSLALSASLGVRCVIGQYSEDTFLLFFPETGSKSDARKRLEDAFTYTRTVLADTFPVNSLRFIAGVVFAPRACANYSLMLSQAGQLCQLWRNAAMDMVSFVNEDDDLGWMEIQKVKQADNIQIHQEEMNRPLSDQEKDVAFECVSAMLDSESLDASMHRVLNYIGTYYQADRVYVLVLSGDKRIVTMPFEWTGHRKPSIQHAVSGMLVSRIPLLNRCIKERAPVFLTRNSPGQTGKNGDKNSDTPWYFTVFPLIKADDMYGFLCVENSREHPADAALFSAIIPYMLKERQRFQGQGQGSAGAPHSTVLTQLPNLRSYMDMIYSLSSDSYSSLGAVCLDVPSLSALNSNLGFEYGSKLLWYVSKTLTDIFGPSLLFRTWDAEFVALCPNTTQEVFLGRCTRLRSLMQRRYPKQVRIGYTWSDGVFNGKNLVNEARSIMRCEHVDTVPSADQLALTSAQFPNVAEAVHSDRITVFLQPIVELKTGRLVGAEALARGVASDGTIIPPAKFIDAMEKDGSIRDLDLFVLERVLSLLDQWREENLSLIPISVNFSRISLANPSALASVLAIQSRYPLIRPGFLELEITESAGNLERATFTSMLDQFREAGIKVVLDDFGSQYANLAIFTSVRFDTVKLDRSLVSDLSSNTVDQMLVKDIIRICEACGVTCVAEGIETVDQSAALAEMGCQYGQGYYYDRPMPAQQFEQKYLRPAET